MRRKRGKRALCGHKKTCRQACVGGCPFGFRRGPCMLSHKHSAWVAGGKNGAKRRQREASLSGGIK